MVKKVICYICKKQVQKVDTVELSTPEGKQPVCLTHPGVQEIQQKPKTKK